METTTYPVFADEFTVGDLLPEIGGEFPFDITGYTLTLHVERPKPHTVLRKTAIIDDAAKGLFHFAWSVGDLVAGLNQLCEIQYVDPSGKPLSKKFYINVTRQVA